MKTLIALIVLVILILAVYQLAYNFGHSDGYNWTMTHLSKLDNDVQIGKIKKDLTWEKKSYKARSIF